VTHIFGAIQDVTEQKLAEAALQEYSERLEGMVDERTKDLRDAQEKLIRQEKLAILGQLAGGVGHDLRNPLSVINNAVYYLNMLQSDADESTQEYLNIIKMEVNTAERIVTDLLNFARTKDPAFEDASPSSLIEQALVKNPAPKSVEVSVDIPADLPLLYVDSRQIIQVLGNLIVNGYQAMPTGGKLSVCACTINQEIEISVSDTGTGISPENKKSIFEPLFTTKAKGIGLGLATSKNLVEANGGTIEFQSQKDVGSTFSIRFLIKQGYIEPSA
jgi:signal transduction histidine kinase